jgi:hypothetical protein
MKKPLDNQIAYFNRKWQAARNRVEIIAQIFPIDPP